MKNLVTRITTLVLCLAMAFSALPVLAGVAASKTMPEYIYRRVDSPQAGGVYCMVSLQQGSYYAVSNIDRDEGEGLEPISVTVAGDYVVGDIADSLLWQFDGVNGGYNVRSLDDGEYIAKLNYALTTSATVLQTWEYIIHTNEDDNIGDEPVMHNVTAGGYILYRTSSSGAYFDCFNQYQQCNIVLYERQTPVDFIPVTGISLEADELDLQLGTSYRFSPTIIPADATNQAVRYTSSNPTVARINPDGLLITGAEGTSIITVYDGTGEFSASCVVTISDNYVGEPDLYGYRIYGGTDGIVRFNAATPEEVMLVDDQSDQAWLTAMCYANGNIYAFEYGEDGYNFITMEMGVYERRASNIFAGYYVRDMAYDPETGLIYCVMSLGATIYSLYYGIYTVNPETGAFNLVGDLDAYLTTIACTDDGRLYGIDHSGRLYLVDKETAGCAIIGSTGVNYANHEQSMCYSPINGRMYWMQSDDVGGALYEINLASASATYLGYPGGDELNYEQVIGLFAPQEAFEYEQGDIDMNGAVNVLDSLLALRFSLEMITLEPEQISVGDMDGDNRITSVDALMIMRIALD